MAMSREEMLEKLDIMVKNSSDADDAVRDYERTGTRDSLERIVSHGRVMVRMADDLQEWHA